MGIRLPWSKRNIKDEMQDQLILLDETRGDPDRRGEYLTYVDAYEKLYRAHNDGLLQGLGIVVGILEFGGLMWYGYSHVIPPEFKMFFKPGGGGIKPVNTKTKSL